MSSPARERVARAWHEGSDHADHSPFGGPLCNCGAVADRMLPMLAEAWSVGRTTGIWDVTIRGKWDDDGNLVVRPTPNPYEAEEDRHVDQ